MSNAYFNLIGGLSGDMLLSSLIDAGLDPEKLSKELNKISEIDENNESEYTPKLFSEESYQTDEVMETKESENLSSDELFNQDSNEDEDFEIPAFLRKQKF